MSYWEVLYVQVCYDGDVAFMIRSICSLNSLFFAVYARARVCVCVCGGLREPIYIYIYIYIHTHIYILCVCVCVCVCVERSFSHP